MLPALCAELAVSILYLKAMAFTKRLRMLVENTECIWGSCGRCNTPDVLPASAPRWLGRVAGRSVSTELRSWMVEIASQPFPGPIRF
jgi:hypothetical protein